MWGWLSRSNAAQSQDSQKGGVERETEGKQNRGRARTKWKQTCLKINHLKYLTYWPRNCITVIISVLQQRGRQQWEYDIINVEYGKHNETGRRNPRGNSPANMQPRKILWIRDALIALSTLIELSRISELLTQCVSLGIISVCDS